MDMGSLLGTLLVTILNYKRDPTSTVQGPLIRLILTVKVTWEGSARPDSPFLICARDVAKLFRGFGG